MKIYTITDNEEPGVEAFTTLVDACKALGVSYRMAILGKRIFKGKVITECKLIKSANKRRNGFKCLEVARMARYKEDNSFDEDI